MIKQLYNWVLQMASHPQAEMVLFIVAFAESSFFPIPPDALLIPMIIVHFDKAFRYALVCTAGSVLGGIFGYAIGALAFDSIGQWAVSFYGMQDSFELLQKWYREYDVYIVGVAGFSPIPYKVFTIFSGFMHAYLPSFVMASTISRGARFFLIAWLLWRGGPRFKTWIETNLYPLTMAAGIILIMAIVLVKFLLQGAPQ
ncbi:MAG: DedA family protein [Proteobacteria bacterium]|nr:DedA family protein [Pseudomonadota bacterium]